MNNHGHDCFLISKTRVFHNNNKMIILLLSCKNQPDAILVFSFRPNIEIEDLIKVNQDTAFFNVKGLSLGTASLTFTASINEKGRATSEPKDIQVRHQIFKPQDNHPLKDFHSLVKP